MVRAAVAAVLGLVGPVRTRGGVSVVGVFVLGLPLHGPVFVERRPRSRGPWTRGPRSRGPRSRGGGTRVPWNRGPWNRGPSRDLWTRGPRIRGPSTRASSPRRAAGSHAPWRDVLRRYAPWRRRLSTCARPDPSRPDLSVPSFAAPDPSTSRSFASRSSTRDTVDRTLRHIRARRLSFCRLAHLGLAVVRPALRRVLVRRLPIHLPVMTLCRVLDHRGLHLLFARPLAARSLPGRRVCLGRLPVVPWFLRRGVGRGVLLRVGLVPAVAALRRHLLLHVPVVGTALVPADAPSLGRVVPVLPGRCGRLLRLPSFTIRVLRGTLLLRRPPLVALVARAARIGWAAGADLPGAACRPPTPARHHLRPPRLGIGAGRLGTSVVDHLHDVVSDRRRGRAVVRQRRPGRGRDAVLQARQFGALHVATADPQVALLLEGRDRGILLRALRRRRGGASASAVSTARRCCSEFASSCWVRRSDR